MKKFLVLVVYLLLLTGCFEKTKVKVEIKEDSDQAQVDDQIDIAMQIAENNRTSCLKENYSHQLCDAINTGNPAEVDEEELLQFAEDNVNRLLQEQSELIDYLYEDNLLYSYDAKNNVFIPAPAMNSHIVLFANKDGRTSAIKDTYKITGVLTKTNHRVGLFSINLLSLAQEQTIQTFNKNLIKWFTREKTDNIKIIFTHFTEANYEENKEFILEYFPTATFNNYGECDFAKLADCIDSIQPHLILYSNKRSSEGEYKDVEPGVKKAQLRNISIMAIMDGNLMSGDGAAMMQPIYNWLGHPYGEQGYGNAKPHATDATVDTLKNLSTLVEIKNLIQRMRDGDFTQSAITGCNTVSTILSCTHEEFNTQFGSAAKNIRALLQKKEAQKIDLFKSSQPDNFLKSIQLLADKYRSQVDYPIHNAETHEFMKALFADYFIYYARSDNQAQPDLGQHIIDKRNVRKGENTHFSYPEIVTSRKSISTTHNTKEVWGTTTGWYALPGVPVTLTRHDANDMKVKLQLHYGRYGTNRLTKTGYYYGPVEQLTRRITLNNGESLTFSTPIGGPIYLSMYGVENLPVDVTAENVALHPAVDDFASPEQIDTFVGTFLNTETPHVDLKMHGAEFHMRKDRFLTGEVNANQVKELLRSTREDHIHLLHRTAALTIEEKPLEETLSPDVVEVCSAMLGRSDCLDSKLHTRAGTQHANFDQNAQCGSGCSGNPWDSGGQFVPTSWLAFHEAGHNLQTNLIGGYYVQEQDRNDWSKYARRSHENSNNIFSYIGLWNYWYVQKKEQDQYPGTGHQNSENLFYPYMSDALGKNSVYLNKECDVVVGSDRFEALWSDAGYAQENSPRFATYMQMGYFADNMAMANGTILKHGFDIFPLLYQHARIFNKYSANESLWSENKTRLGFSTLPWSGLSTYGSAGRTIRHITGNDFMLISLSHLTGLDWSPLFNVVGLHNSDAALEQARMNGRKGALPQGLFMINAEYPLAQADGTLAVKDNLEFVDLSSADQNTTWYGEKFTCED